MKLVLLYFICCFLIVFSGCSEKTKDNITVLFHYQIPFYLQNNHPETKFFYGIRTKKYTYIRRFDDPWLLYDKQIDPDERINLLGLDAYIFIQSDLENQLNRMVKREKEVLNHLNLKNSFRSHFFRTDHHKNKTIFLIRNQ